MLELSETHPAILAVKEVVDTIQALAVEHPGYSYSTNGVSCTYNPTSPNPLGCIVGEALRRCGYDTLPLDQWDGEPGEGDPVGSKGSGASVVWQCVLGRIPNDTDVPIWVKRACHFEWITKVQDLQDTGTPWGQAVAQAGEWRGQVSPPAAD